MDIYGNKEQDQAKAPKEKVQTGPVAKEKKNETKKTAVLVIMLAAAVFILIFSAGSLLKRKLQSTAQKININSSLRKVSSNFQREKEYAPDTYLLEGVICDGDQSYAVINGTVLRLHERIDGLELIKILPSGVELKNPDTGKTLSLSL